MLSISASILLLLNNFVQISVDIWALRDKVLRDDPNQSSAVYLLASDNKHAICGTEFSLNQLLCRKYWRRFFFVKETFDHVTGNENDQVSPTFLSDRINAENGTLNKCVQILFFNNPNFFLVIPKVCLIACVFPFRNLEFEKDLRCTFDL